MTQDAAARSERVRRASRRATSPAALGSARFGIGPGLAAALLVLHAFWRFLLHLEGYPRLPLSVAAWCAVAVAGALAVSSLVSATRRRADVLFSLTLCALASAVGLDTVAVWDADAFGVYPTAAVAVGAVLLALVPSRSLVEMLPSIVLLGVVLVVTVTLSSADDAPTAGVDVLMVVLAAGIPSVVCVAMWSLRRLARHALDRALVQGTVTAAPYGVGMLASEELAALDHEVERLFADVASGTEPLPLRPERAERAATLATELRRHLIDGRRSTWLVHAVAESGVLRDSIAVDDPSSVAARLRPRQRDALLSALWLIAQGTEASSTTVVRFRDPFEPWTPAAGVLRAPVEIVVEGTRRRTIDAGIDVALADLGPSASVRTATGFRVEVRCEIDVSGA